MTSEYELSKRAFVADARWGRHEGHMLFPTPVLGDYFPCWCKTCSDNHPDHEHHQSVVAVTVPLGKLFDDPDDPMRPHALMHKKLGPCPGCGMAVPFWERFAPTMCEDCTERRQDIFDEWEEIIGTPPDMYVACHDGLASRRALEAAHKAFAVLPEDTQTLIAEACRNVSCRCFCGFHGHSVMDSHKAHAGMYVVCLHPGVWIDVDIEGDPGRTLVLANASRFPSREKAYKALADARTYRPFKGASLVPVVD